MKNLKLTLLGCMILLACVTALGLPALASTGSTTVTGTVPLVIYNVQASGITGSTAIISWGTNGNATSQVFYDTKSHADTAAYALHSPENSSALVLQHGVGLNRLRPATTYHYRVKSAATIDGVEFIAISPDYTLPAYIPPGVITIGALRVGSTSALLWGILYNKGSASSVEVYFQWGTTTNYGHETAHQTLTSSLRIFSAVAAPLAPNTTYHFRAVAVGDGTSYGQDQVFRTTKR